MKKLVGAVGYRYVGDLAAPIIALEELALKVGDRWDIDFMDMSYNPVALINDLALKGVKYSLAVIIGAVKRHGKPGSVRIYRYDEYPEMTPDEIQARIADGVSGGMSLENIVAVAKVYEGYYGRVFPEETYLVEIEPLNESWEEGMSPQVRKSINIVVDTVIKLLGGSR